MISYKHLGYNQTRYSQPRKGVVLRMSPELRDIKATEAIKAFERAGGIRKSGKGDHVNVKMTNGRIITLRGKER